MGLLLAIPTLSFAQDEEPQEGTVETNIRSLVQKRQKYETRTITGRVLDATTKAPIGGCIVSTDGVDGYSGLTGDDGTYKVNVPVFATAIYVVSPSHNPVRIGLQEEDDIVPTKENVTKADWVKNVAFFIIGAAANEVP